MGAARMPFHLNLFMHMYVVGVHVYVCLYVCEHPCTHVQKFINLQTVAVLV